MGITSVTKKGQVTIPVAVRRALGIGEQDRVDITLEGDRAVIRKLSSAAELRGSVPVDRRQRGASWKEIERRTAAARGGQGK